MESLIVWLELLAAAGLIFYAGRRLSQYADIIAEKTGVSRGWIGFILLAFITSLPELSASLSSASLIKNADLALGNIFGSNTFNLLIIVLLDLLYQSSPLLTVVSGEHILSASLGILLTSLAVLGLITPNETSLWGISPVSWGILIAYLIGTRLLFKHSHLQTPPPQKYNDINFGPVLSKFVLFSALIICGGILASFSGRDIARLTGLGDTFVGTFLLAVVTSLPEVAVSVGALRLGEVDMALGNLLGSNVFNLSLIFLTDLVYRSGGIFASASQSHIITAAEFLIICSIVLIGMGYKAPHRKYFGIGVDALSILVVYLMGILGLIGT
jgi:cation:H+ antiporter